MKNRFVCLLIVELLFLKPCYAQTNSDVIITPDDTIKCHIIAVNDSSVIYSRDNNNSKSILRNQITYFSISNTTLDQSTEKKAIKSEIPSYSPEVFYQMGTADAGKYYTEYGMAGTSTLVISILSPLVGLIPSIACSSTLPKDRNLSYHNSELIKNIDYHNGYLHAAKKIKRRHVWTNWEIAFGINLVLVVAVLSNTH
jgi:hypothetical protein